MDEKCGILSTGGGAFLAEENRIMITKKGVSVWLNADIDLLWNRVKHKQTRPLLRTVDPKSTLREIYEKRVPIYALADISVAAKPSYSIEDMASRVVEALEVRQDVLERVE